LKIAVAGTLAAGAVYADLHDEQLQPVDALDE
jgi:hypothetical protein